ncbi:hypothetical protein CTAYLR_001689 [Chrysophaeum taylorii]|uniref:WWE domain-containing protein n=1 Tax=Chrysophaeum taylorii TaxID=2483200 RepID=A0AAD7XET2_9STRA|nr:hypothetical protein CTAYLR_001689 [Chrysophaeum taylorii]
MDESEVLLDVLRKRKASTKEIESTVDATSHSVETVLPSFFDLYPRAKRAYDKTKRIDILRACERVLRTGDEEELNEILSEIWPGRRDEVIDVEAVDYVPRSGFFEWQAHGGEAGWFDFAPEINGIVEEARVRGEPRVEFEHRGQLYVLDLEKMIQINVYSSTARPVRKVEAANEQQ